MNGKADPEALASLALCESILLSLTDLKLIDQKEMRAILEDAAEAHRESSRVVTVQNGHAAAAKLIEGILDGGNSVRRGMGSEGPPRPIILPADRAPHVPGRKSENQG